MKILIVGQGYAGSMLAWYLLKHDIEVTVVDNNDPSGSTRVSAGIMLPVTGRRLAKTHNADIIIPFAQKFYQSVEQETGISFFTRMDVLQIFTSLANRNEWYARTSDPGMESYAGELLKSDQVPQSVKNDFGAILLKQSGFVRPTLFLGTMKDYISKNGIVFQQSLSFDELRISETSVSWRENEFDYVIFCEGFIARQLELFGYLPFNPAKGEILDFESEELSSNHIIVNGAYIVPLGDGKFRTGATYEWKELDCIPTEAGKNSVESNLKSIINCDYRITGHRAGVRPSIKDRRALLGFHPGYNRIGIFNGLGTKGAMHGPYYAKQMADLILHGKNPDADVNIKRFESLYPKY